MIAEVEEINLKSRKQPRVPKVLERKTGLTLEEKIKRLHGKKKERFYRKKEKTEKWKRD